MCATDGFETDESRLQRRATRRKNLTTNTEKFSTQSQNTPQKLVFPEIKQQSLFFFTLKKSRKKLPINVVCVYP